MNQQCILIKWNPKSGVGSSNQRLWFHKVVLAWRVNSPEWMKQQQDRADSETTAWTDIFRTLLTFAEWTKLLQVGWSGNCWNGPIPHFLHTKCYLGQWEHLKSKKNGLIIVKETVRRRVLMLREHMDGGKFKLHMKPVGLFELVC